MSSPKLRVIFRPKSEIQTFFSPKFRWSPKKQKNKKKKGLHQNWEWFFGRHRKFKRFFRPNSGGVSKKKKKKKKKKGLHQNWDWFFAGFVTFRSVGGDASRNGAELFETEADFSAKIVTFRLVGGMHPPHPPPLNPPLAPCSGFQYSSVAAMPLWHIKTFLGLSKHSWRSLP